MRSLLEKALVALINKEDATANALFHDFILERSRQIHESLRQGEDFVLDENWEKAISIDEMFNDVDLSEDDEEGEEESGMTEAEDDDAEFGGDSVAPDAEVVGAEDGELSSDDLALDGEEGEEQEDSGALEDRVESLEDQLQRLAAAFDAEMGTDTAEQALAGDMGADGMEGEDGLNEGTLEIVQNGETGELDLTHHVGDENGMSMDAGFDAAPVPAFGDDDGLDGGLGDDEFDDLAESVVDDLEKVKVKSGEGRSTGTETFKPNTVSPALSKPVDKRQAGEPVKQKGAEHKGYERQTSPTVKPMEKRQNTRVHGKDGQAPIKKEGDKSALLNTLGDDAAAQDGILASRKSKL